MDYEAAFQRERKARKNAEQILEKKSRELHFANAALKENVSSLHFAVEENKFLIHISDYGINRPKLRDFLPPMVNNMMVLSEISFAAFAHFPFNTKHDDYFSPLFCNPNQENHDEMTMQKDEVEKIIKDVEPIVREKKELLIETINLEINSQQIDTLIALPIMSLGHLTSIIILLSHELTEKQTQLLDVFRTGTNQLGIIIEHRYQDDKLLASYQEIASANEALKEAQNQLIQSEKMATVGQLSAGIAHEINNPMGFIKSNLGSLGGYLEDFIDYIQKTKAHTEQLSKSNDEAIIQSVDELDKTWKDIDMDFLLEDTQNLFKESQQGIKRIIDIVGGLKRFSHQSEDKKEPCHVTTIIEEALKLANNELKYKGVIHRDFHQISEIEGNSGELLQVFLNLFVNAAHAMNEQGELNISVKESDHGVSVMISDNGCGIDQEHLDSIFNPFFTTKDVGVGTGLGLSISYGIIESHEGTINVTSKVGDGTTFNIWLPYPVSESKLGQKENLE